MNELRMTRVDADGIPRIVQYVRYDGNRCEFNIDTYEGIRVVLAVEDVLEGPGTSWTLSEEQWRLALEEIDRIFDAGEYLAHR
jgi:hypothetical protein